MHPLLSADLKCFILVAITGMASNHENLSMRGVSINVDHQTTGLMANTSKNLLCTSPDAIVLARLFREAHPFVAAVEVKSRQVDDVFLFHKMIANNRDRIQLLHHAATLG
jgi:hypothetical protein